MPVAGEPAPWRRLRTRVVRRTPWFEVRADDVVRPDGARSVYDHVVLPAAVTVLALNAAGRVAVTRQWIYTHAGRQWRLPGGAVDPGDTDPAAAARRELAEETGLSADWWEPLGVVHGADSSTNHRDHLFHAEGLTCAPPRPEPGELDLRLHWLPFDDLLELVLRGQVPHAGSAVAVLTAAVRRPGGPRGHPGRAPWSRRAR